MSDKRNVLIVCMDEATVKDVSDMLNRVSASLSAVDCLADKVATINEEAANAQAAFVTFVQEFFVKLIKIYPNPRQLTEDAKSIGAFTVAPPPP